MKIVIRSIRHQITRKLFPEGQPVNCTISRQKRFDLSHTLTKQNFIIRECLHRKSNEFEVNT